MSGNVADTGLEVPRGPPVVTVKLFTPLFKIRPGTAKVPSAYVEPLVPFTVTLGAGPGVAPEKVKVVLVSRVTFVSSLTSLTLKLRTSALFVRYWTLPALS